MLKSLAIVLLVATFAQAPEPAPHETAKGRGKSHTQRDETQDRRGPTSAEAKSTEKGGVAERQVDGVTAKGKENTVNITRLPPITSADKRKTFRDSVLEWGPWVSNLLLVIVGGFQVFLLWRSWKTVGRQADTMDKQAADAAKSSMEATLVSSQTLAAIKRQADLMEKQAEQMEAQTVILKNAVAAANASAVAAKISADIAVGVSLPKLVIHELGKGNTGSANTEAFFQYPKVRITIKNYGQTAAFLKWWALCFSCEDLPEIPIYGGPASGMILDKIVVQPNDTFTLPDVYFPHRHEFSMEDVKAIVSREKPFHVYGYVCYGDVFGNPLKRLKFCETVLNIFGGETVCDWWEGLAPHAYTGTEDFPSTRNPEQGKTSKAK